MNNYLLRYIFFLLIVSIYIYFRAKGKSSGFMKRFLNVVNVIVSIFLTKMMTGAIIVLMKDYTNIQSTVSNLLYKIFYNTTFLSDIAVDSYNIFNSKDMDITIKLYIEKTLSDYFLNIIFAAIVFSIFVIILKSICKAMDLENMILDTNEVNKKVGGFFGIVEATCFIWLFFLLFRAIEIIPTFRIEISTLIEFPFVKFLYEENFFYKFLNNIFTLRV